MANNVLGFFGIEAYDLMLYLSRILIHLNRKVLLVDYSENRALSVSIPRLERQEPEQSIIQYNGVNFTRRDLSEIDFGQYSDVFICFGFVHLKETMELCTEMIYVTDQQKHYMEELIKYPLFPGKKEIIIRNVVQSGTDEQYIKDKVGIGMKEENAHIFYLDERDIRCGLLSQYDTKFCFHRASKEIRRYLMNKTIQLCPLHTQKDRKKAYKAAERGK